MRADRIIGSGHAVSTTAAYGVNIQNSTGTENEYKSLRTQWEEIPADERWKKIILLLTIALFGANYIFIGYLFVIL
jgi:hypothetical protein